MIARRVGVWGSQPKSRRRPLVRLGPIRVDARELDCVSRAERRMRVREEALAVLREEGHILSQGALAKVVNEVSDAVVGMGPVELLLKDPDVTEVLLSVWTRLRRPLVTSHPGLRSGGSVVD